MEGNNAKVIENAEGKFQIVLFLCSFSRSQAKEQPPPLLLSQTMAKDLSVFQLKDR